MTIQLLGATAAFVVAVVLSFVFWRRERRMLLAEVGKREKVHADEIERLTQAPLRAIAEARTALLGLVDVALDGLHQESDKASAQAALFGRALLTAREHLEQLSLANAKLWSQVADLDARNKEFFARIVQLQDEAQGGQRERTLAIVKVSPEQDAEALRKLEGKYEVIMNECLARQPDHEAEHLQRLPGANFTEALRIEAIVNRFLRKAQEAGVPPLPKPEIRRRAARGLHPEA